MRINSQKIAEANPVFCKYPKIFCCWFAAFSFFLLGKVSAQALPELPLVNRHLGTVTLSNGVYLEGEEAGLGLQRLENYLAEWGVVVSKAAPQRRSVKFRVGRTDHIDRMPSDARHGYDLRISPLEITIEATSPQGITAAVEQFRKWYEAEVRGSLRRIQLPCAEIRGWVPASKLIVFRPDNDIFIPVSESLNGLETLIPPETDQLEWIMTDSLKGWFIPGYSLHAVGYTDPIHSGVCYSYHEIEQLAGKLNTLEIETVPVFDLRGTNARFEMLTGHPMLSVEGFRFVRVLLEEFLSETNFTAVGFIIPDEKYQEPLQEVVTRVSPSVEIQFLNQ